MLNALFSFLNIWLYWIHQFFLLNLCWFILPDSKKLFKFRDWYYGLNLVNKDWFFVSLSFLQVGHMELLNPELILVSCFDFFVLLDLYYNSAKIAEIAVYFCTLCRPTWAYAYEYWIQFCSTSWNLLFLIFNCCSYLLLLLGFVGILLVIW